MEKVTTENLMREIECMLKDEFVAKIVCAEQGIEICFLNGQKFILRIESVA